DKLSTLCKQGQCPDLVVASALCADSSSHRLDSTSSFCDVAFSVFQPYHQPEPVARKMTLRGNFCTTMCECFCSLRRCFVGHDSPIAPHGGLRTGRPAFSAAVAREQPTP